MKIKSLFVIFIFMTTLFFLVCKNLRASEVRGVTDKSIKVGAILPITGPAASLGVHLAEAIRTYTKYINDTGGVNGRQLNLIVEDDRYSIPPAIAAFKKLVYKDRVFTMIGPGSGSHMNVLWKHIEKEKLPTMSIVTPEIAFSPLRRYIFSVMDTYPGQVNVLVDYMIKDFKLKEPKVALVYPDTEVGKIDREPAIERLKRYNITPVTKEVLAPGTVDASTQVMSLRRYNANCVLHVGTITPTTITLLRDLRKMGLNIPVFGSWGAMLGEEMNAIGEAANQFYSVHAHSPWYDKGIGIEAMRKITLQYHPGTEKPYRGTIYTHAWLCTAVLVEGLKRAGRNLDEEALINALESTKKYDTGGLSGPISYSLESHKGGNSWKIYKADPTGGKYVPLTGWRIAD
ncbi:MAG: amino acid/amide ABC transporter substrate-binding protein HAAT family [bacterium]|nr:MAG: amino acid/amide ABC transporter substrate-binding protein HAAT family [bacterium]